MIVVLLLALLTATVAAAAEPPAWPLDLDTRYLTGNFMEPRDGRFHTGLDLKTNSRTGYPVIAARDGYVARARCSVNGYGKAVYLVGDDGLTYVYAHLDRFADDLRSRVRAEQTRQGRYEVDLHFGPDRFPVRRGQVLALSGQTATLGPHLHFEVRGPDGLPRDPLAHGFAVTDTLAPEILAVRLIDPSGEAGRSLVMGDGRAPLQGELPLVAAPHGAVRFSARIVERSDHLRYRLGAWRVRLQCDGWTVLDARNDELDWRLNRQQRLEFLETPLGRERWLWQDPRVALADRARTGEIHLGPGDHRYTLTVEDRAGNRSQVSWTLRIADGAGDPGWSGWPNAEAPLPVPWLVAAREEGAWPAAGDAPAVTWRRGPLHQAPPPPWWRTTGLEPVGDPVQFRAGGGVLVEAVMTAWPDSAAVAAADGSVAVYRLDDDAWTWETALDGGAFLLDRPGVHALLRDQAPPVIATAVVDTVLTDGGPAARHGVTLPRWPVLKVPVGDHGSGVDWPAVTVRVDGRPVVAEPDAPRDRLLIELPDATRPGRHRLEVVAPDRAGHRTAAAIGLHLRGRGGDADDDS